MTMEPISKEAMEGLDKICLALYAQRDFLHLSFDFSSFSQSVYEVSHTKKSQKEEEENRSFPSFGLGFKKWLSFCTFEQGVIFGSSLLKILLSEEVLVKKNHEELPSFWYLNRPFVATYDLKELFCPSLSPKEQGELKGNATQDQALEEKKKYAWQQMQKLLFYS